MQDKKLRRMVAAVLADSSRTDRYVALDAYRLPYVTTQNVTPGFYQFGPLPHWPTYTDSDLAQLCNTICAELDI